MSNVLGLNYSDESSGDDDEEEQKPLPAPVASAPPPLPPPPQTKADHNVKVDIDGTASDANPQLQQKLERWLALKASQGANFNRSLMSTREYRNPHMYRKLVEFFDLNEHGTNYPPDAFDPRRFPQGAYYEELGNAQRERMQAVAERQQQRSQIAFVAGGPSRSSGR
ncbi:SAP30-binding protein [Sorochytrium milnesiophthora]